MLSLRMKKQTKFHNFAIKCTPCIDNAFRIWSFSADFYFDIKHQKEKYALFLRSSICIGNCFSNFKVTGNIKF